MTRPDVAELLQAIATAQGVDVAQVRAEIVERYAAAHAAEIIGEDQADAISRAHAERQEARARELQDRAEMRAEMRRRRAEGQSLREIAAALGVNRSTVSKATGKARDAEAHGRIRELLGAGMTEAQVMDTLAAEGDQRHRGKLQYLIRASRREAVTERVHFLSLATGACPTERGSAPEGV